MKDPANPRRCDQRPRSLGDSTTESNRLQHSSAAEDRAPLGILGRMGPEGVGSRKLENGRAELSSTELRLQAPCDPEGTVGRGDEDDVGWPATKRSGG